MTNFQPPKTWLGHNATPYPDFNALPDVLSHASLIYILSDICPNLGYLEQHVTTGYRQFFKKSYIYIYIYIYINLTVTRANLLEYAQNQKNLKENL